MRIDKLEGKNIAIVAMGASQLDFHLSLIHSKTYDEICGINCMGAITKCDRVFMMDPASRFYDTENAGNQTSGMLDVLENGNKPIYTCELDERCDNLVEYPINEVLASLNFHYLNNTVAYAVAFALWNKVGKIKMFGIDFRDRKSTRLNSSHSQQSRMPSSA